MSTFFKQIALSGFADEYVVWTRPPMAFLFDGIPNCTVMYAGFPVGTFGRFRFRDGVRFLRDAVRVRRLRPSLTLDMVGDFRERLFARLIGSRQHLHIGWSLDHPYRRIIRNPFGDGRAALVVGEESSNVYDAYGGLVAALLASVGLERRAVELPSRTSTPGVHVGLHPSASQACKLWPKQDWLRLVDLLLGAGLKLTAFGAPGERADLDAMFGRFGGRVRIVTGSIPAFAEELAHLDLLVGLDSFSVHMAEAVGVASVMLIGPNDPTLFAPPHATVISSSGNCAAWPCLNKPSCESGEAQYVCIRSIGVDRVCEAIFGKLALIKGPDWRSCVGQ